MNESLSDSATLTYPGTFECPTDLTLYVDGLFEFTVTYIADLDGPDTGLTDQATVTAT